MVAAGEIRYFSMCLTPNGGAITVGGVGNYHSLFSLFIHLRSIFTKPLPAGSLVYTPIIEESYYVVNLTDTSVYGSSIGVDPTIYNRGEVIIVPLQTFYKASL